MADVAVAVTVEAGEAVREAGVADVVPVVVITDAAVHIVVAPVIIHLNDLSLITRADTRVSEQCLVIAHIRARHAPSQEISARSTVIRAVNTVIVPIVVLTVRARNTQRNALASRPVSPNRTSTSAHLYILELFFYMPISLERCVVQELHRITFTYIAIPSHRIAGSTIITALLAIILSIVIVPSATISVLCTNIGNVIDEVLITDARASLVFEDKTGVEASSAQAERRATR